MTPVRVFASLGFDDAAVERDANGVPTAFRMWRAGLNRTDHGDHYLTPASIELLLEQQTARGNRYAFDIDHMSLDKTAPAENHRAVGWFSLEERNGDLWCVACEWTPAIAAGLSSAVPEWKYFSPAYDTKKQTGEIVRLLNCALTSNPATWDVTALATTTEEKEKQMDYERMTLAALVAAFEDETDEDKCAAMKKCILAKLDGEKPDDGGDDDEIDERTKKKIGGAGASVVASIADQVIARVERRQERAQCERILAALPPADQRAYADLSLSQLQRIVRHAGTASDVLTRFASAGVTMPVRGEGNGQRASMLPAHERAELDRQLGIRPTSNVAHEEGALLVFDEHATPADAERVLASIEAEKKNEPSLRDDAAFARVLARANLAHSSARR